MISMAYDLAKISMTALMRPVFDAGVALTRLDERIARSPAGQGFLERTHFADACASLWVDAVRFLSRRAVDSSLMHAPTDYLHNLGVPVRWRFNADRGELCQEYCCDFCHV
ncbi:MULTISPECIES: hypothetical protein [Agrobacterium]|jgi:hypothetical protein|uniref:hypothetical protein n=1 Tax=Agrobacterium salinitolerans TaxID=1183413 RepID=UPI0022B847C5|nr:MULTISPECIES: hypothetical protein [Agrobacterium]MCZ7888734.1 hypothetical protein [Agrobacterium salinitolerans]MDA5630738.1 hypothetical protein [Agrobacterium sp. ST15.16.055]MDA5641391.1 hypothetical protein [Agrobacterium sp. ST15.13.013]MDA6982095.1 hypothetical protein [Agrobacterium salinitolerans]MDA7001599.1 hypothetical protein [Agrobacterium salinitolerans]